MVKATLKFARVRIIATCYALVFLGSAVAGQITWKTWLAFIAIAAFTVHANSINDYADRKIDEINLKDSFDRPLVTGDISNTQFWLIHIGSGLVTLLVSVLYGLGGFLITLGILFIDYIYSLRPIRVTDRTLASPLLLAAAYVYYSFLLGFWASSHGSYPWLLSVALFLGFLARLLLKDYRDVKGDKEHGKITFLIRYGSAATCIFSGVFWLAAMLLVGFTTSFSVGLVTALALGVLLVFLWLKELAVTTDFAEQQVLVAVIAKAANFAIVAILAFYLCAHQPNLSGSEVQVIPGVIGVSLLVYTWLYRLSLTQRHVKTAR